MLSGSEASLDVVQADELSDASEACFGPLITRDGYDDDTIDSADEYLSDSASDSVASGKRKAKRRRTSACSQRTSSQASQLIQRDEFDVDPVEGVPTVRGGGRGGTANKFAFTQWELNLAWPELMSWDIFDAARAGTLAEKMNARRRKVAEARGIAERHMVTTARIKHKYKNMHQEGNQTIALEPAVAPPRPAVVSELQLQLLDRVREDEYETLHPAVALGLALCGTCSVPSLLSCVEPVLEHLDNARSRMLGDRADAREASQRGDQTNARASRKQAPQTVRWNLLQGFDQRFCLSRNTVVYTKLDILLQSVLGSFHNDESAEIDVRDVVGGARVAARMRAVELVGRSLEQLVRLSSNEREFVARLQLEPESEGKSAVELLLSPTAPAPFAAANGLTLLYHLVMRNTLAAYGRAVQLQRNALPSLAEWLEHAQSLDVNDVGSVRFSDTSMCSLYNIAGAAVRKAVARSLPKQEDKSFDHAVSHLLARDATDVQRTYKFAAKTRTLARTVHFVFVDVPLFELVLVPVARFLFALKVPHDESTFRALTTFVRDKKTQEHCCEIAFAFSDRVVDRCCKHDDDNGAREAALRRLIGATVRYFSNTVIFVRFRTFADRVDAVTRAVAAGKSESDKPIRKYAAKRNAKT